MIQIELLDPDEVDRVARVMMDASEAATDDRILCGAALMRAMAGYWARLAVDTSPGGFDVETVAQHAEVAALHAGHSAAALAAHLVRQRAKSS